MKGGSGGGGGGGGGVGGGAARGSPHPLLAVALDEAALAGVAVAHGQHLDTQEVPHKRLVRLALWHECVHGQRISRRWLRRAGPSHGLQEGVLHHRRAFSL